MLIPNEDGKSFTAGPLDMVCILHDVDGGRFHVAFFEEHPMPGPLLIVDETKMVRLMSRLHHTEGADSLKGAKVHIGEIRGQIVVSDENVIGDRAIPWDGDIGIVWLIENWKTKGVSVGEVFSV